MKSGDIERIVKLLNELGIRSYFGVAGGGLSLDLITALESSSLPYYPVFHEASAALMAGACCRDGRCRAAAISIKGPGFVNLLPGMLSNYYENRPALSISEAYGASVPASFMHKRFDHRAASMGIVKAFGCADAPEEDIRAMKAAAQSEAPGPWHLNLCAGDKVFVSSVPAVQKRNVMHDVIAMIERAKKPIVILGSVTMRCAADVQWTHLKVPVLTTAAAKGVIDENSPYSAGIVTGEADELSPEATILPKADCVVAIGLRNTEVIKPFIVRSRLAIIDSPGGAFHEGFGAATVVISEDVSIDVGLVTQALLSKEWGQEEISSRNAAVESHLFGKNWQPPIVFRTIQSKLPEETMLCLDTGLFCVMGETVWRAKRPGLFCGSSNGRFMGVSIPTAIGAAISSPGTTVVCAVGDGGIAPYFPEMRMAIEKKLPLLVVLMSDGCYGTVAMSAATKKSNPRAYIFPRVDWWQMAQSMGCPAVLATGKDEVASAVGQWQRDKGPLFIETRFDPDDYITLSRRLR